MRHGVSTVFLQLLSAMVHTIFTRKKNLKIDERSFVFILIHVNIISRKFSNKMFNIIVGKVSFKGCRLEKIQEKFKD